MTILVRQLSDGEELVIEEGCWSSSSSSESPPGETFFARRRQAISGDDDWSSRRLRAHVEVAWNDLSSL
jgi:hypothetical protein